jgi:hypothetical protein
MTGRIRDVVEPEPDDWIWVSGPGVTGLSDRRSPGRGISGRIGIGRSEGNRARQDFLELGDRDYHSLNGCHRERLGEILNQTSDVGVAAQGKQGECLSIPLIQNREGRTEYRPNEVGTSAAPGNPCGTDVGCAVVTTSDSSEVHHH